MIAPESDKLTPEQVAQQIEVVRMWLSDAMEMMFVAVQQISLATLAMQQVVREETTK